MVLMEVTASVLARPGSVTRNSSVCNDITGGASGGMTSVKTDLLNLLVAFV